MRFEVHKDFWRATLEAIFLTAATFVLAVSSNLASASLPELTGVCWWFWTLLGPVLFVFAVGRLWTRLALRELEPTVTSGQPPPPCKGLVVLVSHGYGVATAKKAIEYHQARLERLWMVHSEMSLADAEEIRRELLAAGKLRHGLIAPIPLSNADFADPGKVQEAIETNVYGQLPESWRESDVILDITGGQKQTTAGAFLAGLPKGRRLEVNKFAKIDPQTGRGEEPGDPVEITIDYDLKPIRRR
jgi:hypothetical protein